MTMGHRIAVLNQGRLQQIGTPMELYRWPSNLFVAEFIGSPQISLLPVTVGPNATLMLGEKKLLVEGPMVDSLLTREGEALTAWTTPGGLAVGSSHQSESACHREPHRGAGQRAGGDLPIERGRAPRSGCAAIQTAT